MYRLSMNEWEKLQSTCGYSGVSLSNSVFKIAFGGTPEQGQFPWALLLRSRIRGSSNKQLWGSCTGVFISRWHFLTAAHCTDITDQGLRNVNIGKEAYVLAGSPCAYNPNHAFGKKDCRAKAFAPVRIFRVKSFILPESAIAQQLAEMQPEFIYTVPYADIALFELREPLSENDTSIWPVCLPDPYVKLSPWIQFFGYGATEKANNNVLLQYFTRRVEDLANKNCRWMVKAGCDRILMWINDPDDTRTACSGDSGGGITSRSDGRYYLRGILGSGVSYCKRPSKNQYYSVATRVDVYHDFICYHAGICPMGYDHYMMNYYDKQPEPFIHISDGKGRPFFDAPIPEDVQYYRHPQTESPIILKTNERLIMMNAATHCCNIFTVSLCTLLFIALLV